MKEDSVHGAHTTEDARVASLLTRSVASFIDPEGQFKKKLEAKIRGEYTKDIVIKLGVDPTRPDIHLGHAVILHKLRAFQDAGCKVIFLIGDFTSLIGDPTGKSKVRPEITLKEVRANMQTYLDQVDSILSLDKTVFAWTQNSNWFDASPKGLFAKKNAHTVTVIDMLAVLRRITHARLIERDMFQDRLKNGNELYMHEMLYPVMQGIDSAILAKIYGSCDLEIGGTDQTFNMLMGRDVMRVYGQPEQSVMSMDILEGLDGKEKMSKSLDNYIGIADEANDMYGKVMSIPDHLIVRYGMLATKLSEKEITEMRNGLESNTVHPKEAKMKIARAIVAMYHDEAAAVSAEHAFANTFAKGGIPEDIETHTYGADTKLVDALVLSGAVESKGEVRRLIEQGAVTLLDTDTKITDAQAFVAEGNYRIGKHRFVKIVVQ